MTEHSEAVSTLNNLIETCRDGQQGFRSAADAAKSEDLKRLFKKYVQERAELVTELQMEVKSLGGSAENTGSVAGAIHRGWTGLKTAITGNEDAQIVAEVERGEDSTVRNYRDALSKALPEHTRSLLERQFKKIKEAHDKVRALEVSKKVEKELRR